VAFGEPQRRRNPAPLIIAVIVGVVAIFGTYLLLKPGGDDEKPGNNAQQRREGCVPLVVSASSEKAALLTELAGRYHESGRTFDGKCADVQVFSKASGGSTEALGRGWDTGRDGGPAPDVWSPASSSWVRLLQQRLAQSDRPGLVPDGTIPSIAQTPLVIAMPRPMAQALGWPKKPLGWGDVLGLTNNPKGWGAVGHPEWGKFRLGKTNPNFSTSGLNATIGAYFAATNRSSDLTSKDLTDPKVISYVKGVEAGAVHYGDTTLTFLSNLANADAKGRGLTYISAVTVEEKSVYDYNQGNPTGDPKLFGKGRKPGTPLVAIYPKEGTLLSDNPFVTLTTASDERRAAADDFRKFLQEPAQQKRFGELAFRSFDGKTNGAITEKNGLLPDHKFTVIDPPSPAVLQQAVDTWDTLRKRARVLLVLDVSGSMDQPVDGGGSRMELAKKAAQQAIGQFSPDDEVGLWTFSTGPKLTDVPYTKQVPIAPIRQNGARIKQVIGGLAPEGGTALYRTTRDAQRDMLAQFDPTRINAVVLLTDGRNEFPPDNNLDSLIENLSASEEQTVRVFPIAYGDKADLSVLKRIAEASDAVAYEAIDEASIDKVLTAVVSNF
jgi:Ca-activated chloride channel family protein